MTWQPISECPKEPNTAYVGGWWYDYEGWKWHRDMVYWVESKNCWWNHDGDECQPTHFLAIPEPPDRSAAA